MTSLTRDLADGFASLALSHVSREYPNKLDHVLAGPGDVAGPRALHPIFFGSFDWHSCVHGYWLMARALRRFPGLPSGPRVEALFADRFTEQNVAAEVAYLARPASRGFERPYGWAWLLALQAELDRAPGGAALAAADTLRPLADAFAERLAAFLPLADYPVRAGAHTNTAFALRLAADDAEARNPALFELLRQRALAWYGEDRDAQAWEPSGDDFLSPVLIEAECLRRFLEPAAFRAWFDAFLPRAGQGDPATVFVPARLSDRSDGKIAHLDGLNLSRAWCWRGIASTLESGDPRAERFVETAETHLSASLPHVAGDYMGEHWLATFAMLALDGA